MINNFFNIVLNNFSTRYKQIFNEIKDVEKTRCVDLVHYNICIPEAHALICQRIYADEIASLTKENFLYNDCHFVLDPMVICHFLINKPRSVKIKINCNMKM